MRLPNLSRGWGGGGGWRVPKTLYFTRSNAFWVGGNPGGWGVNLRSHLRHRDYACGGRGSHAAGVRSGAASAAMVLAASGHGFLRFFRSTPGRSQAAFRLIGFPSRCRS